MSDGRPAPLQWRPMVADDLPAVDDLAARIHPDFPERPEVLAEKFRLFPHGCFVLDLTEPGLCGYCFSHPWDAGPLPALDTPLRALPQAPTTYFIHDLALVARARGQNLATILVPVLLGLARDIPVDRALLVAVSGSEPFWLRMGFRRTADETLQNSARGKYGEGAVQMECDLR